VVRGLVCSNADVMVAFLAGKPEGWGRRKTVVTDGVTLWSYRTELARRTEKADGSVEVVIAEDDRQWSRTTRRHKSNLVAMVRAAGIGT